jgi:hypothetical protein
MNNPELKAAIVEFTKNEPANRRLIAAEIAERAMLLAITATRTVYFNFPDRTITAATNNWEIGREMLVLLDKENNPNALHPKPRSQTNRNGRTTGNAGSAGAT